MKQIIHYPTLKTVLAVESVLKNSETALSREEIKRRLSMKIMHQTLNLILKYLEERGMILDGDKKVLWVYNPNIKLKRAIAKGMEI